MNRKGFTLIELLGVIIILGILAMITFPVVLNQIKNAKQGIKDSTKALIIDAAKDYYEDNTNNYETIEGMTYCIDINTLTDNDYLNKKLKDEKLNDIDTTQKVKMIYHNDKFNYDVTNTCNNNILTRNNIEVPIVTSNSGLYQSTTDPGRFIYRGGNPINNWIELNEGTSETPNYIKYRIISFEQDGTIKVVREESIGNMAWDNSETRNVNEDTYCRYASTYGCNVWGNENNTYFENNKLADLSQNFFYDKQHYGTVTKDSSLNTYLNENWISAKEINNYVLEHFFNVGGLFYNTDDSIEDKGIKREKEEEKQYTWNGKIGLINVTEFVEASTNLTCTSVFSNKSQNQCGNNNWMYDSENSYLTLSAFSQWYTNIWIVSKSGYFGYNNASYDSYAVRPAFYLKSDITLTGEGTETNPYRIAGES